MPPRATIDLLPGGRGSPLAPPGGRGSPLAPPSAPWRLGKAPLRRPLLLGGRRRPPCHPHADGGRGRRSRPPVAPLRWWSSAPAVAGGLCATRAPAAAGDGLRAPSTPAAAPVPWRPALGGTRAFHGRIEAESGEGREEGGRKELRGRGGDGRGWIRLVGRGSEEIKMGGLSVVVDVCTGSFLGPVLI